MMRTRIDEGETLWDILRIAEEYQTKSGVAPLNISHWDQSKHFKDKTISYLRPPLLMEPIDYIFSYELQEACDLRRAFGYDDKSGILVTPSGSTSILCAMVALKESGVTHVVALAPYYWSMRHVAEKLQMQVTPVYLKKTQNSFCVSCSALKQNKKHVALWVTSPVYCTGVYYDKQFLDVLTSSISNFDFTVVDESLAIHKKEISPMLSHNGNVISIHTPHKSVCTNGLKFSCIVFPRSYQNHFDQWSDVLYGCMSIANKEAVLHFLSNNFDEYSTVFHNEVDACRERLVALCSKYSVGYDEHAYGYLNTLYFPMIKADFLSDAGSAWDVLNSCHGFFIPGVRNHFSEEFGLCFRVNHALDNHAYWATVERIMRYFSSL